MAYRVQQVPFFLELQPVSYGTGKPIGPTEHVNITHVARLRTRVLPTEPPTEAVEITLATGEAPCLYEMSAPDVIDALNRYFTGTS